MNDYLDIATSLYTNSLTLFVGTGFSKYMTNNKAPNWIELLVDCTHEIDEHNILFNQLFVSEDNKTAKDSKYELTICAQILEIAYLNKKKNIKEQIANIIKSKINEKTINQTRLKHIQKFFNDHPNINIITTNYDTIFSEYILPLTSRIIVEGSIMSRVNSGQNIYHIHGCINRPESLILTINDYYNFQNSNNYFSRKFFTLLQETTVTILGYSLGDFNLNSILNEVKNSKRDTFRRTDIYYVTKDRVAEVIEKFYEITYGIKVIQETETDSFLDFIEEEYSTAESLIKTSDILKNVISGTQFYKDEYLKLKISLNKILIQASNLGIKINDEDFINTLMYVLDRKRSFTTETGAWAQYEHLADWLIEIASRVVIKGTTFESKFMDLVKYSLNTSSKVSLLGFSWSSWQTWKNRWKEIKLENKDIITPLIKTTKWHSKQYIKEILD
ncbi:SIR2 family NAD-dependent protein deacylase [Aquirufa nivalisilvae]